MSWGNMKIVVKDDKVLTLEELFKENEKTHKETAAIPFKVKIQILVTLQEIAYHWGGKKDVIIWQLSPE